MSHRKASKVRNLIDQFALDGHNCAIEDIPNHKRGQRWLPVCTCGWRYERGLPTKHEAVTLWRHAHIDLRNRRKEMSCPHPRKLRFKTEAKAQRWMDGLPVQHMPNPLDRPRPTRAYKCKCGFWHTTSKPQRTQGDRMNTNS